MSHCTWNTERGSPGGLYRDPEHGWLFGVCAGIADRFNLRTGMVRLVAVVSLLLFFWATLAVYLAAALLVRQKPLIYRGHESEYEFWRRRDYRS
ncbi:MAG: PspC domain-containing protein [Woeseiaceae bacterium]|nr:PspC domain-containing protein [Woeseiaceae bacterium]